jgi:A/G-specific adenine glycosylase
MPDLCSETDLRLFRSDLRAWFQKSSRDLPWRTTRDPYHIWLSEAMLQQTRVNQAMHYYSEFVSRYPTVFDLASAPLEDVLKTWEGLGYYARARNLHRAAGQVVSEYGGTFPADESAIRALPGVGTYTAAAVLSIAFNKPHAAVDGNVTRVLSRYFLIEQAVDATPVRRLLADLAQELLDPDHPGQFNQSVMELGATVCTPRAPSCSNCVLAPSCLARFHDVAGSLPRKRRRKPTPHYDVAVAIVSDGNGGVLVRRRPTETMLGGLWELPGGKRLEDESMEEACQRGAAKKTGFQLSVGEPLHALRHAYSHFKITLRAFEASVTSPLNDHWTGAEVRWASVDELADLPFSRASRRMLDYLVDSGHIGGHVQEDDPAPRHVL